MVYSSPPSSSVIPAETLYRTLMKITYRLTAFGLAALMTTGCIGMSAQSTLGPSSTGVAALLGSWTSGNLVPQAGQCTDFRWDVTEQTGNSAPGTFQRDMCRRPSAERNSGSYPRRIARDLERAGNSLGGRAGELPDYAGRNGRTAVGLGQNPLLG